MRDKELGRSVVWECRAFLGILIGRGAFELITGESGKSFAALSRHRDLAMTGQNKNSDSRLMENSLISFGARSNN